MKTAIEYAVCFSNADEGVVVFGVSDRTRGLSKAIHAGSRATILIPGEEELWSGEDGFLVAEGIGSQRRYMLMGSDQSS